MYYWSEEVFQRKLKKIKEQNKQKEYRILLREERKKSRSKFKLPSTSKIILLVVILMCLEIILFCQYAMLAYGDTSALYALIGIPTVLVPTIWGYYSKSKAENTAGGITYDLAMLEANKNSNCEESIDAVG